MKTSVLTLLKYYPYFNNFSHILWDTEEEGQRERERDTDIGIFDRISVSSSFCPSFLLTKITGMHSFALCVQVLQKPNLGLLWFPASLVVVLPEHYHS